MDPTYPNTCGGVLKGEIPPKFKMRALNHVYFKIITRIIFIFALFDIHHNN